MSENEIAERVSMLAVNRTRGEEKLSLMLSVGREIRISDKAILCRDCSWEGMGAELSCGLMKVIGEPYLLYAYRCPVCLSFNIIRKGKLLKFRPLNSHCDKNSFDEL